jgi:hypothetical protein
MRLQRTMYGQLLIYLNNLIIVIPIGCLGGGSLSAYYWRFPCGAAWPSLSGGFSDENYEYAEKCALQLQNFLYYGNGTILQLSLASPAAVRWNGLGRGRAVEVVLHTIFCILSTVACSSHVQRGGRSNSPHANPRSCGAVIAERSATSSPTMRWYISR